MACCPETKFPLSQTHLLPFISNLLPSLSAWHLKTEHSQPSLPPSCHTCQVHEKRFFRVCLLWGQASSGFLFLPLWTVRCWHHIVFQILPKECVFLAVVSAVRQHVSQSIPKLALIPAALNRALWLFHPLLSLEGQSRSPMGRLTAGMLSVQFPPPKAELWSAGSFVFSCLTFDLRTGALVKQHGFLRLTLLLY